MKQITAALVCLIVLASTSHAEKKIAEIKRSSTHRSIDSTALDGILLPNGYNPDDFRLEEKKPFFPDDPCTARMVGSAYWAVDAWLAGDEVYKVYQDIDLLANDCSYPFYVTAVAIQMQFAYPGSVYVQADVEGLDPNSTDACPAPGPLLGISEEYGYEIPAAGVFLIVVVLEEPVLVDTSYFAGMYIAEGVADLVPALVTDDDPYQCVSWNDWGLGWVDLVNNQYYGFPGNLVMYSYGYNAGFSGSTPGSVSFYAPSDSAECRGIVDLCLADIIDTSHIDQCNFEYSNGSGWNSIGVDTSPDITLRNGATPSSIQPGFSYQWNTTGLTQGWYLVRSIAEYGGESVGGDTISVYVDNTPLAASTLQPDMFETVCDTITIKAAVSDEDASLAQFELRPSSSLITRDWPLLDQFDFGDVNGNPADNNPMFSGEFGDYYNGPTIVASALKYFGDRGYPEVMYVESAPRSAEELVEILADSMNVRDRFGTQDDNMISRLKHHLKATGGEIDAKVLAERTIENILYYMEYRRGLVMLGISQPYGYWLGLSSIDLPPDGSGDVVCQLYDTRTATYQSSTLSTSSGLAVLYDGSMRSVDKAIACYPAVDTVGRSVLGGDYNPADGFSLFWDRFSFADGEYYLSAITMDLTNRVADKASMISLGCEHDFERGNVNGQGGIDIDDVIYVIAYIFSGGPPPTPVLEAGNANCLEGIDMDDVIYLIAFIFGGGPPPCE